MYCLCRSTSEHYCMTFDLDLTQRKAEEYIWYHQQDGQQKAGCGRVLVFFLRRQLASNMPIRPYTSYVRDLVGFTRKNRLPSPLPTFYLRVAATRWHVSTQALSYGVHASILVMWLPMASSYTTSQKEPSWSTSTVSNGTRGISLRPALQKSVLSDWLQCRAEIYAPPPRKRLTYPKWIATLLLDLVLLWKKRKNSMAGRGYFAQINMPFQASLKGYVAPAFLFYRYGLKTWQPCWRRLRQ